MPLWDPFPSFFFVLHDAADITIAAERAAASSFLQ
jgi:hypothetical protein